MASLCCDAAAQQPHRSIVKLDLGTTIEVVDAGFIDRQLTNVDDLDRSLILVPLLCLGLRRRVVISRALGLLRHLLKHLLTILTYGLLLDGRGFVHGVSVVILRSVSGAALAHGRALASNRREARAAADGRGHSLGGAGHLDNTALALARAVRNLEGVVDVGVSIMKDTTVALLNNIEGLLNGLAALKHDRVLLNGVVAHIWYIVLVHLLINVRGRSSAVHNVAALRHSLARDDGGDRPTHDSLGRSRRSLAHVGLGGAVVHGLVGAEGKLVRAAQVLDHGDLAAETLEATVVGAYVGALAGVDAAMAGKGGRLNGVLVTELIRRDRHIVRLKSACRSQDVGTDEASRQCEFGCERSGHCAG